MIDKAVWTKTLEKHGYITQSQGYVEGEPFVTLAGQAMIFEGAKLPTAKVNAFAHNGIAYGEAKVGVSITLSCPQTEQHIEAASEAAFLKALEMVNQASVALGIQPLPKVY